MIAWSYDSNYDRPIFWSRYYRHTAAFLDLTTRGWFDFKILSFFLGSLFSLWLVPNVWASPCIFILGRLVFVFTVAWIGIAELSFVPLVVCRVIQTGGIVSAMWTSAIFNCQWRCYVERPAWEHDSQIEGTGCALVKVQIDPIQIEFMLHIKGMVSNETSAVFRLRDREWQHDQWTIEIINGSWGFWWPFTEGDEMPPIFHIISLSADENLNDSTRTDRTTSSRAPYQFYLGRKHWFHSLISSCENLCPLWNICLSYTVCDKSNRHLHASPPAAQKAHPEDNINDYAREGC